MPDTESSGEETQETQPRPHGLRSRLAHGMNQSLHGNATAFGYSLTITASFGAVQVARGMPRFSDLFLFAIGGVAVFGGLQALLSRGFRDPLEPATDQVVALGTALAFISVALSIASARGMAALFGGGAAWFAGAFGASLVFALVEGLEFMFAQWLQERRGADRDDEAS